MTKPIDLKLYVLLRYNGSIFPEDDAHSFFGERADALQYAEELAKSGIYGRGEWCVFRVGEEVEADS